MELAELPTEQRTETGRDLDLRSTRELVELMNANEARVGPDDAVVGVSASGRTPYVLGALDAAVVAGAFTVALVSVPGSELTRRAAHEIAVVVGPEVLSGSTRLKAGTAQKLVLN